MAIVVRSDTNDYVLIGLNRKVRGNEVMQQ